MSTEGTTRKRMGLTAIVSSIFIVATLVWGFYSFYLIQSGIVRPYPAHYEYDLIEYWPYENGFAGDIPNWFQNLNYTNLPLEDPLPENLLDHLNDTVFLVAPADPGQLWRIDSYDYYNGAGWSKTVEGTRPLNSEELISYDDATNDPYVILLYAEAGATVGAISLPSLFPSIRVIEDSFDTWTIVDGTPVIDDPSRLIDYDLETDEYGTLLFSPFIEGETGEQVLISFEISYVDQDLENVQNLALPGTAAFLPIYTDLTAIEPLTSRVQTAINQFTGAGTNAYETAMAVKTYFQTNFQLMISEEDLSDRPDGQEVTDWFLERGGGLPQDFATAYCVFMRDLGIPARIVSGYALGDRDPVEDFRTVMVRHMTFWVEVYIPMSGLIEGEWIQVIPAPLPDGFGGGEDPINTPIPDIELLVFPTSGQYWAEVGDSFEIGAIITVDGVLITTPDTVIFYDETDTEPIGSTTIGQSPLPPIANISYVFPSNATIDYHTISASWSNPYYLVRNTTRIYAVGTPTPSNHGSKVSLNPPSEIIELNINQGLDTHVALWNDYVHVYGVMTVGGTPVNSSRYGNQYIQIMWDNAIVGDAHIDEYGYYEFNVHVDPMDLSLMTVGPHDVWSSYAGDWDPIGGFYRLLPANSTYTSVVTVYGRVSFTLTVTPQEAYAGATLQYDGSIQFMNGSLIPSGQSVGVFFGTQTNTTRPLNLTGGFQWSCLIPLSQSDGTYFARANFTSPWQYILGNWSLSLAVNVGAGGSQILLNPLPDPLFIGQDITFSGYLQYVANGTGISGQNVTIWWLTDSIYYLGQASTAADGYFEFDYTIPAGYEGPVTYWANYTSAISGLSNSESTHLSSTIKRYDPNISIFATPDPVRQLQTVVIQGVVSLPENSSSPLVGVEVQVWWGNSTYPGGILLGSATTNATGGYIFYYQVPFSHVTETVYVWVTYTSLLPEVADAESLPHEPLTIDATNTFITINEDFTYYYLNETVYLYGNLQFLNGTPIAFQTVYIHWISPDGTVVYQNTTDINGDYWYIVPLNALMTPGTVNVHVNWTSPSGLYTDALNDLQPPIQLIQYANQFTPNVPTQIYLDENLYLEGTLTYVPGGEPIAGVQVYIGYFNGTHYLLYPPIITNSTGGFNYTLSPSELDALPTTDFIFFYQSGTNLISDAYYTFTVNRVQYQVNLEITVFPNPVMQNGTVTIHAYLYFAHNSTPIAFSDIDIYWFNGTEFFLGTITTDGTGQADLDYSGMAYDTVRTGIEVYGYYAGTTLRASNASLHEILTLQQWQTQLVSVNTDDTQYQLTETVIVTGTLQFVSGSTPYAGVTVELYLSGVPLDSTITASDGSFTLYWYIASNTTLGDKTLEVRFTSSYPWIAGTQTFPVVNVYAPGYLWSSFTVSPLSPTPLYILNDLTISGVVTWDNSTPYAFSDVTLYWGNPATTYYFIANVTTDGTGYFTYTFQVPAGTTTGNRYVWAYIPPQGYATSGTSPQRVVFITQYRVDITVAVDVVTVHLGENIVFSGTAQFSNGTPLTGYQIEIWWHSTLINTATVTAGGTFSYTHYVPYSLSVGLKTGYAYFNPPTAAYEDATEFFEDVTVREYIDIYMDTDLSLTIYTRGQSFVVTGYVLNDAALEADGVIISVLMDGSPTGSTYTTGATGTFSITVTIDSDTDRGEYTITVTSLGSYHDIQSITGSITIEVYMNTEIHVMATSEALQPGETISVLIELNDDDGMPVDGATILVFLDETQIASLLLTDGSGMSFDVRIPTSWTGSGTFAVGVEFADSGTLYLYGDIAVAEDSIHVFTDVDIVADWPSRVNPGTAFSIQATFNDPDGNPIIGREVLLALNETNIISLTTDADGRIRHDISGLEAGQLSFTITLISDEVADISSDTYTILIQTQGGIILQGTDLIIAGILLVGAVIAVLAYLYIVKGMFRSVVISRGIDIPTKLRNIKKLADAGKYGASITLAYRTFEQMCGSKMGSERNHSETAREYLDRVMQTIPLDAATVEQFVQTYEEARFSHHEMTRDRYEAALRIFTDLYPRIDTGVAME